MEKYLEVAKVNVKHNLCWHCILGCILIMVSPFIMGMEALDQQKAAQVLEVYVSLFGILLLVPIFIPDQDKNIRDLLCSKKMSMLVVYGIRVLESLLLMGTVIAIYLVYMKYGECTFSTSLLFWGVFANAVFLGGVGVIAYSLFDNIAIAYMVPILYYICNMGSGSKYLGKFYLFGMMTGNFETKWYLLISGSLCLVAAIFWRVKKEVVVRCWSNSANINLRKG